MYQVAAKIIISKTRTQPVLLISTVLLRTQTPLQKRMVSTESNAAASEHSILPKFTSWLQGLPVRFGISSSKVQVLKTPQQFFNQLCDEVKEAKRRIVFSSLYLGNGDLESKLVDEIRKALAVNTDLSAHVLLDYARGSRGENNSRSMLLPCLENYPERMTLSLYHTPNLRGVMKSVLPDRFNELLGLQHMKVYLVDDTVMLSGANMSKDYFTNRQDRYIVIKDCPQIADYFTDLIDTVSQFSYQADKSGQAKLFKDCQGDPTSEVGVSNFIRHAQSLVNSFRKRHQQAPQQSSDTSDTWIYPLLQMGSFHVDDDYRTFKQFLALTDSNDKVFLSTAYFNPLDEYTKIITEQARGQYHIMAASPQVNGFFNAAGVAGYIPNAYTCYEKSFLHYVNNKHQSDRITLYEYMRDHWTFHAKGLWFYPSGSTLPSMTMIGSSNFGYRSVHRDLEVQVVIATENKELQQALHEEKEEIYSKSQVVTLQDLNHLDRKYPFWTSLVARISKSFF